MDLDDEELKATRKINGSDKNVGSIEEDIKILENLLEEGFEAMCYLEAQAIEHLIKAYKELEEENKRLKPKIDVCNWQEKSCREIIDEKYVPVSLIKEKIEELNNSIDLAIDNSKGGLDEEFIEKGSELLAQKRFYKNY